MKRLLLSSAFFNSRNEPLWNGCLWRKAVGRINDLIGSSELVYSKVIRPPIGMLDADQGTQSAL